MKTTIQMAIERQETFDLGLSAKLLGFSLDQNCQFENHASDFESMCCFKKIKVIKYVDFDS